MIEAAARLTVEIPNGALARKLVESWSGRPGVSLRVLRARVCPGQARFELDLRGARAEIHRILRQGAAWQP